MQNIMMMIRLTVLSVFIPFPRVSARLKAVFLPVSLNMYYIILNRKYEVEDEARTEKNRRFPFPLKPRCPEA